MSGRQRGDTTLHEFEGRFASVLQLKRWLALIGVLVVMSVLAGLFLVISFAIRETGRGADPNVAFSPTENVPGALAADVAWLSDAENLVRIVEPTTRAQLGAVWLRADDALSRAASGDLTGLEVWFVDAALSNAMSRFEIDLDTEQRVSAPSALGHRLRVDFYSLDGQIVVLDTETIRPRPIDGRVEDGDPLTERFEVVLVLSDGNWRVRHVERLTAVDVAIQIQS
ncbi:MAG: hypothetical protein ACI83Y_001093 [Candidatus Azotimanducaceae bacterium]|jgi:hypothetical protein|tara:strand:+ start:351 stop:1028 length:678 start_codon:yes stop_codon:yes gene_type:complete